MFSLDPEIVATALGDSRLATWEWISASDELCWTSGQADIYTRPTSEITSSHAWEALIHPNDRARVRQSAVRALETGSGFREEFRVEGRNGNTLWIFGYARPLRRDGHIIGLAGMNMDVTPWVEKMASAESRFTATFEQAAVGIAHIGRDGRWLNVNRRCCEIVGYTKEELFELTFSDITHPDDRAIGTEILGQFLRGERTSCAIEKRYFTKDGHLVWVNVTVSKAIDHHASSEYFITVIEDVTARKQLEAERDALIYALEDRVKERTDRLEKMLMTDSLTGVANRRALDDCLAKEWGQAARTHQPLSALLIDIDYFKGLNDSLGHAAADQVLISIAGVLSEASRRPSDLASRYGGDEFVVVLPNTHSDGAMCVAEQISEAISRLTLKNPGSPISSKVTVSQGIATLWPMGKGKYTSLMLEVDRALYIAKKKGRNRIATAHISAQD